MTVHEKWAWFTLAICLLTLVVFAALVPVLGAGRAWGAFGIIGFAGLPAVISRWRGRSPAMDERDQFISRRAQLIAYRIFWIGFVATSMITWKIVQDTLHKDTLPVDFLPFMLMGAFTLYLMSNAIATLVEYRRGQVHEI